MDYNKINKLFKNNDFVKMDFYKEIGITATGFRQMMENKTIKVETLERIAEFFNVPIVSFFSGSEPPETTKEDLQQKVNELYEENRQLMKENKKLLEQVQSIKESQNVPVNVHTGKLK